MLASEQAGVSSFSNAEVPFVRTWDRSKNPVPKSTLFFTFCVCAFFSCFNKGQCNQGSCAFSSSCPMVLYASQKVEVHKTMGHEKEKKKKHGPWLHLTLL